MRKYKLFEQNFHGPERTEHWADIDLNAVFTHEDGTSVAVRGFYAGEGVYPVRFLPKKSGL